MKGKRNRAQKKHHTPRGTTSHFTLIELLVVISIIGILTTILIPSLRKAREAGKRAICLNNVKQIGFAFIVYADDNGEYFPMPYGPSGYSWDDYLAVGGYDGRSLTHTVASSSNITDEKHASKIYYCPTANYANSDPALVRQYVDSDGRYALTYGSNHGFRANMDPEHSTSGLGARHTDTSAGGWSAKISDVANTAETITIGEHTHRDKDLSTRSTNRAIAWDYVDDSPRYHGRHGKLWYTNMSFTDGHATYLDIRKTWSGASDNMWDRN
jgi:prepilin-type N-terminal cleavage/methylation domain-containing protein/prepilin-type processing-associated H-X9-DG protein